MGNDRQRCRVLIADSDDEARRHLAQVLAEGGFRVIDVSSGETAMAAARNDAPALIILEVPLDGISGYEVCRQLREEHGDDLAIVFVSETRAESYDRVAGLLVGADDYLVKPYAVDELLVRLRRLIARKERELSPALSRLTAREQEVLRLLAEGLSGKEIASRLVISARTVSTHIEHILAKLNVGNRVQAVALAFRAGLTTEEPAVHEPPLGQDEPGAMHVPAG